MLKNKLKNKVQGSFHLLAIVLLAFRGFYVLFIGLNFALESASLPWLIVNGLLLILFSFLILWFGLIPSIVVGIYLSVDFILPFFTSYGKVSLLKFSVLVAIWLAVYELAKNRKLTRQKKAK